MAAPLAALQNPGEADDGRGDEKKLRADTKVMQYLIMNVY
jgi:hypothetical protein